MQHSHVPCSWLNALQDHIRASLLNTDLDRFHLLNLDRDVLGHGLGLVLLTRLHILLVIEVWAWYRNEHRHRVRDWLSRSSRIRLGWKVTIECPIRGVWNGLAECTDLYWWEAEDRELSCCVWKPFPARFSRAAWLATGSRIENMSLIKFCVESPSARSAVKLVKC